MLSADNVLIQYGTTLPNRSAVTIPDSEWLYQAKYSTPEIKNTNGQYFLFPCNVESGILAFDLLAMTFFCLSRWEEYGSDSLDTHGRFPASASLLGQHGCLDQPVLDIAIGHFKALLQARFPKLVLRIPTRTHLPTYDIDVAWAFRHRSLYRHIGAWAKSVKSPSVWKERWGVLVQKEQDPYDIYDELLALHQNGPTPIFFFLLGDYGPFDKNIHFKHPALRQLIQKFSQNHVLGIHPSYNSNAQPQRVTLEKERLETILQKKVLDSRQHFLKLSLPQTYRHLLEAGIRYDYSMGYADAIGFRAGTAYPFPWYDVEADGVTPLTIYPIHVMDVTLKQYLALDAETAFQKTMHLWQTLEANGGTFVTLWHNSSFYEKEGWAGWRERYKAMVMAIKDHVH